MPLQDSPIIRLMVKYARREPLTEDEMRALEEWWRQSPQHAELAEQFGDEDWVRAALAKLEQAPDELWIEMSKRLDEMGVPALEEGEEVTEEVGEEEPVQPRRMLIRAVKWAAVVLPISLGVYLLATRTRVLVKPQAPVAKVITATEDVVLWTGNDGQTVDISNLPIGASVPAGGQMVLKKVDSNSLVYTPMPVEYAVGRSSLAVGKKCGQFHLQMPDGSGVWLASGSRLEYPVNSRGEDHPTTFSGLGYFDVVKDMTRPWVIRLPDDRRIMVHGTVFMAQGEEGKPMKVSLFSGKIQVFKGDSSRGLSAGEEIDERLAVRKIKDPVALMAWVNPSLYFHFNSTPLADAIQQVADWYGYSIVNHKKLKGTPITDDVFRPSSPEKVIQAIDQLETNYASVHIKDRSIIVDEDESARK